MKIFDCCLFFNELELLELRFEELYNEVDYFIIAEANVTNNGVAREFVFEKNKNRFEKYLDKVIYVKAEDCPPFNPQKPLELEYFKRNVISRGYKDLAKEGDKILVSDVDEIPNMEIVKQHLHKTCWVYFQCDLFYYYVNCQVAKGFGGTVMATYGDSFTPSRLKAMAIRKSSWSKGTDNIIIHAGWHYSYLCGDNPDKVREKIETSGDADWLLRFSGDRDEVVKKIQNHLDPFGRRGRSKEQKIVDISNNKPKSMDKFLEKYPQYFFKQT